MGANVKTIRNRIRSVDSTMHITKAMQLVASSKLRRATFPSRGRLWCGANPPDDSIIPAKLPEINSGDCGNTCGRSVRNLFSLL